MLHQLVESKVIMDDQELYTQVYGPSMTPQILPYARVRYVGGTIEIVLVAYDNNNENHIIVGFEPSDGLKEILDNCSWDNS